MRSLYIITYQAFLLRLEIGEYSQIGKTWCANQWTSQYRLVVTSVENK